MVVDIDLGRLDSFHPRTKGCHQPKQINLYSIVSPSNSGQSYPILQKHLYLLRTEIDLAVVTWDKEVLFSEVAGPNRFDECEWLVRRELEARKEAECGQQQRVVAEFPLLEFETTSQNQTFSLRQSRSTSTTKGPG